MSAPGKTAEGYGTTEMIKLLLEIISAEIGEFKRFRESSRQVVSTSIEIYELILQYIADIDKKRGRAEELEWKKFKAYTDAIAPLEDLLLQCNYHTEEQHSLLPVPRTTDVPSCLKSIELWIADQETTVAIIRKLQSGDFKALFNERPRDLGKALFEAMKKDDTELIFAIHKFISQPSTKLKDETIDEYTKGGEQSVSGVKQMVEAIVTHLAQNYSKSASHVIKIILLVYFPFALFEAEGVDAKWLEYLASKRVWDEMYSALNDCYSHLKVSNPGIEVIGERYQSLAKTLFTMTALPPMLFEPQVLEMMQIAKHVRRPFNGRSAVLVFMWSHVVTNRYILEERNMTMRRGLRMNVTRSLEILKNAHEQLTSSQRFEDAAEVKALGGKFDEVFREMERIYSHYKMADKWNEEIKPQLDAAVATDTERYDRVRSRVQGSKASRALGPPTPKNAALRMIEPPTVPASPLGMAPELPSRMSPASPQVLSQRMPERLTDSPTPRSDRRIRRT